MRIRSIKPEFWRSDDITSLDIADRLLFIGLWSYVDDNGVGWDSLAHITADLFAADLVRDSSETFARVSRGLSKLAERGQIVRYEGATTDEDATSRSLLSIVKWEKHQRIDKPGRARYTAPTREDVDSPKPRETVASPTLDSLDIPAPGAVEQGSRGSGTSRKRSKPKIEMPEGWKPNAKHIEKAKGLNLDATFLAEQFTQWHKAKGSVFADWDAAFFTWIGNANSFGGGNQRPQLRAVVNDGRPEGW